MTLEGAEALPLALAGLVLAALVAFLLTPLAARFATAVGAVDRPGARRIHRAVTPRGGGLAVATAFVLVGAALLWYERSSDVVSASYRPQPAQLVALIAGAAVAALLGFVDDRRDLRARWQFLGQLVLALFAVAAGMRIGFINNPLAGATITFGGTVGAVLTVFWVIGMINSINFIDGLDGLSSGIAMIAALTLGGISFTVGQNQPVVAILCFTLAGALAGFLPWNFHPARIFVGTAGVFVIGYTLAVLSLLGTAKVAVALLVLGVPIIDTFWIIVRRLAQGSSPFAPDRGHFHHRLLDLGLGHREAVLLIYAICALLAVLSFRLSGTGQMYAFLGIVVGGGLVLYLLTARARVMGSSGLDPHAYEDEEANGAGAGGAMANGATADGAVADGAVADGAMAGAPAADGIPADGPAITAPEVAGVAPGRADPATRSERARSEPDA